MKYLRGERIMIGQAVLANCYSCMCGYTDGKRDCSNGSCPIYPFMPYREGKTLGWAVKVTPEYPFLASDLSPKNCTPRE